MHSANFEDFELDLWNWYSQSRLYIGFTYKYRFLKSLPFLFGGELGCFKFVWLLSVEENAGMPEICRIVMDYEYQEKKENY
jgi:hypothetical protein